MIIMTTGTTTTMITGIIITKHWYIPEPQRFKVPSHLLDEALLWPDKNR